MVRSSFRLIAPILGIVSISFLLSTYAAFKSFNYDPNGCQMSWSRPIYTRLDDFTSNQSRMGNKYSIYMYREGGIDPQEIVISPKNIPVLFIPGNAGSYKQGRSIASYCAKKSSEINGPKFDFFLADFKEDFTAFHGRTLMDQAQYLNDAIEYILSLYDMIEDGESDSPTSVIVIGHSMGGIVARTLITLPNYVPNSINTIITLSTPHTLPPLTFDRDITNIYDKVNQYWRKAFSKPDYESSLRNISLISITGGQSDTMVPSDYTAISSIIPPSHGFTVFSYSIPFVWTGVDHLAMVWCAQLRKAIGDALYDIVDQTVPHRTIPLDDRMSVFRKYLLSGFETGINRSKELERVGEVKKVSIDNWNGVASLLEVPKLGGKLAIGPMTPNSAFWIPDYVDTSTDGKSPVLFCRHQTLTGEFNNITQYIDWTTNGESKRSTTLECVDIHHYSSKLPLLPDEAAQYPFEYDSRAHTLSVKVVNKHDDFPLILHAVNTNTKSHLTTAPFNKLIEINDSLLKLAFSGKSLRINTPFTHILFKSVTSSLISYRIKLKSPLKSKCTNTQTYFTPFIRQFIEEPHESRVHINVLNKPITVINHGRSPFIPYTLPKPNLHLQIFTPPFECQDESALYTISISIDLLASLGNLAIRFRTLIATLPIGITTIIFLIQLNTYNNKGIFMSFNDALNIFVKGPLLLVIIGLQIIYFSLSNSIFRNIIGWLQIPSERNNILALEEFDPTIQHLDIFLGTSEPTLWYLVPVLILVTVGLCYLVNNSVKFILENISSIILLIRKPLDGPVLVTKEIESKSNKVATPIKGRKFILIALALTILFFVPYQIALLGVFIQQLINTISIIHKIKYQSKVNNENSTISSILSSIKSNNNKYNFNMTITLILLWVSIINGPLLIIWIHNLSLQWSIAFSSVNNIISVLPIILLVQEIGTNSMIPRISSPLQKWVTTIILVYISLYSILFAFLHSYLLHHLINYLSAWLLVLYFDSPTIRTRVGKFLS